MGLNPQQQEQPSNISLELLRTEPVGSTFGVIWFCDPKPKLLGNGISPYKMGTEWKIAGFHHQQWNRHVAFSTTGYVLKSETHDTGWTQTHSAFAKQVVDQKGDLHKWFVDQRKSLDLVTISMGVMMINWQTMTNYGILGFTNPIHRACETIENECSLKTCHPLVGWESTWCRQRGWRISRRRTRDMCPDHSPPPSPWEEILTPDDLPNLVMTNSSPWKIPELNGGL